MSRSQRETCVTSGASAGGGGPVLDDLAEPVHAARAAVVARERRRHALGAPAPEQPDVREDRLHASASSMSWFFGEKASIDGWITIVRTVAAQSGT